MRHKWLLLTCVIGVIFVQATFSNPVNSSIIQNGNEDQNNEKPGDRTLDQDTTGKSDHVEHHEDDNAPTNGQARTESTKKPSSVCTITTPNYDCIFKDIRLNSNESKTFGLTWKNNRQKNVTFIDSRMTILPKSLFDAFPFIEMLNAEDLQIEEIESQAFENAGNLTRLYLQRNLITSIETFEGVPLLIHLDLSYNRINQIKDDAFERNTQLINLLLNNNQITNLPNFQTLENLKVLNLSNNELQMIPDNQFRGNHMIQYLGASYNHPSQFNLQSLNDKQHLLFIDVSYNNLERLYIPQHTQKLDARNNSIYDVTARRCSLENLYLSHNLISDISSLRNCKDLLVLDLSHNKLQSFDLIGSLPKLRFLNVAHNQLFEITLNTKKFHPLEILDLSYNYLSFGPVNKLHKMKILKLNNNKFIEFKFNETKHLNYMQMSSNQWSCNKIKDIMENKKAIVVDGNETCSNSDKWSYNWICCKDYEFPFIDRLKELVREIRVHENVNKIDQTKCKLTKPTDERNQNQNQNEFQNRQAEISKLDISKKQIIKDLETNKNQNEQIAQEITSAKTRKNNLLIKNSKYTRIIEKLRGLYGVTKEGLISSYLTLNRTVQFTQERNSLNKALLTRRTQEKVDTNARLDTFENDKKKRNDENEALKAFLADLKKREASLKKERLKLEKDYNKNSPSLHGSG